MAYRRRIANSFLVLCLVSFSHVIASGLQGNPRTVNDATKPTWLVSLLPGEQGYSLAPSCQPGRPVLSLRVRVTNRSGASAPALRASEGIEANDNAIPPWRGIAALPTLAPGASVEVIIPLDAPPDPTRVPGKHEFQVVVDPNNRIQQQQTRPPSAVLLEVDIPQGFCTSATKPQAESAQNTPPQVRSGPSAHVGLPPNPSALSKAAVNEAVTQPQPAASKPADDNENSTPTEWWMYAGQTSAEVDNTIHSHNARIINVKYDNLSPNPFTAVYVPNTGAYGRGWWWWYGIDEATLQKYLHDNNARLVSLKAYENGQGQLRFTAAMIANTGPYAKGWWYYYGQSPEDIARLVKANNARLVSLQSYTWNGQTKYAVIMIANTGADQKGWWWWVNMSPADIGKASTTNNARLLDLTYAGNGNFNVVMESCSGGCPKWWWWFGMDGNQMLAKANQNNARIISVETYPGCGSTCFAAVMIGGSLGADHGGIVHPLSPAMTADDNENPTPTEWWMYAGQTPAEVDNTLHNHKARIVNIKYDDLSPFPFTAVYVPNTGAYERSWWWWYGIDEATLQKYLHDNNARLVSLKAYENGQGQLRFTAAMNANTGPYAKGWWYYYGQTPEDIARLVKTNNARLVSLQSYTWNGQTKYAVIMIANTGADQKGWWWWVNMSPADIGKASTTNNARLLDLTYAGNGNFNVVMESCSGGCPKWWWWFGMDGNQMLAKAKENNARIISVETYPGCGSACFAAVMIGGSLGADHGSAPTHLRGFVDLHTHPLSNLAFGGKLIYGGVDVGSLLPSDPDCNHNVRAGSMHQALGHDAAAHGMQGRGGVNFDPFGGHFGVQNSCGDLLREQVIHVVQQKTQGANDPGEDARGADDFPEWPKWNDITHQKMWVDWIHRAYEGGLRVMVALAVNNKTLGDMIAGSGDYKTDDVTSADLQIAEAKGFVGRHGDFMAIAYSAEDVRNIVAANKMAVILGTEIDKIGNFDVNHPPSNAEIDAEIDRLYAEGVRYVFPIHIIDNAFGGAAVADGYDQFNYSNYREDGRWWNLRCADPADNITYRYKADGFDFLRVAGVAAKIGIDFAFRNPPAYPNCPQRKDLGLTPQGIHALEHMMQRGMLVDIDHMSQESFNQAIGIAAQMRGGYPLFSGHSDLRTNGGSERNPTAQQYSNISKLHGMTGVGSANMDDCAWTRMAIETIQAMGDTAVGFGTDTDGLAMGMPPCKNRPPIQYGGGLSQSRTGQRTWDYNKDGVAHYGMLTDFLEAVRLNPAGNDLVDNNLMYGAEYFYQTWKLAEARAR